MKKQLIVDRWTIVSRDWDGKSFKFSSKFTLSILIILTKLYFVFRSCSDRKVEAAVWSWWTSKLGLVEKWTFRFYWFLFLIHRCSLVKINIWKLFNYIFFVFFILFNTFSWNSWHSLENFILSNSRFWNRLVILTIELIISRSFISIFKLEEVSFFARRFRCDLLGKLMNPCWSFQPWLKRNLLFSNEWMNWSNLLIFIWVCWKIWTSFHLSWISWPKIFFVRSVLLLLLFRLNIDNFCILTVPIQTSLTSLCLENVRHIIWEKFLIILKTYVNLLLILTSISKEIEFLSIWILIHKQYLIN